MIFFGKKKKKAHECPNCKNEFYNFESIRDNLKGDGRKERIFCLDVCPNCGHVYNEGILTL